MSEQGVQTMRPKARAAIAAILLGGALTALWILTRVDSAADLSVAAKGDPTATPPASDEPDASASDASALSAPSDNWKGAQTAQPDLQTESPDAAAAVSYAVKATRDRFAGRPGERYPVDNVALSFGDMLRRAQDGDLMAALTLHEDLQTCENGPWDQRAFDRRIANEVARYAEYGGSAYGHASTITTNRELYRYCAGLTDDHMTVRARIAGQLADAGNATARLGYLWTALPSGDDHRPLTETLPPHRERGLEYLRQELERGNPMALSAMGGAYASPRLAMQDVRRQYMYLYAYAQTPGLNPYDPVYVGLAGAEARLNPSEIAELQREGIALYRTCCGR
jgi:hypothetical protein